jgi:hypothetical protein
MTTHNRQEQTLYTLNSFKNSIYKDIEVIIVDDSTKGYLTSNNFNEFTFKIIYIKIDNSKKTWINPCVNYNIGFQEVTSHIVIIQNAEVCHCGDVIKYAIENVSNQSYLVYDVCAIPSLEENHIFYKTNLEYNKISRGYQWYQHIHARNANYHFLTAITSENLGKLNGFDIEFAAGTCYDDDEFIFRIKNLLQLTIINVINENTHLLGIHQWHERCNFSYDPHLMSINQTLFNQKCKA